MPSLRTTQTKEPQPSRQLQPSRQPYGRNDEPVADVDAEATIRWRVDAPRDDADRFLEGGWGWMLPILIFLIIGLACRHRAYSLPVVLDDQLEEIHRTDRRGAQKRRHRRCPWRLPATPAARSLRSTIRVFCVTTRASTPSRSRSYPTVRFRRAQMESGLTWIGLFIALSPMLGFMGTVVGMIDAFDAIQAAGDISPTLVAGGIKVALLTTLMGLIRCGYSSAVLQLYRFEDRFARKRNGRYVDHADRHPDGLQQEINPA